MSIRARLLLLALLATALPGLLVLGRFLQEREQAIGEDAERLVGVAQLRAELIAEKVDAAAQLHVGLGRAAVLFGGDRDACSAFLSEVREKHPQYTGILTIRPDGSLFCDSLRTGRELDLRDRAYFRAALHAADGVVLEPVFGRLTGLPVLQIASPVRTAAGDLAFVLLASLNLAQILGAETPAVDGARMLLLGADGTLLVKSDEDAAPVAAGSSMADTGLWAFIASGGGGTREIADAGAPSSVWASARTPVLSQARLHLVAGVSTSALVAPANRRFVENLIGVGVVGLLVFFAVFLLAERGIRRPLSRISQMAEQLAAGNLSARIEPPLPPGEVGALMVTLNQTAASLEQHRADIERLDEHLRQSQRMEAVGQLTGGIAHDFNNLLTVVMGNAELLASHQEGDPDPRTLIAGITSAAESGAQLTQRLLAFARKQALAPRVVDLNVLVASMEPLLRRTLGEHIEISTVRAAGLWPALIDTAQLENALLNLCVNARDAMPAGGRLTLETANVRLDAEYAARTPEVRPGRYVLLAVSDTGTGIDAASLPRVFEPFFTTKEVGKGTGLGLAMVYGFVKQSAGHVTIYSEPGEGTTVKLYLPPAGSSEPADEQLATTEAVIGGTETILLVEDDDSVRGYAVHQLRAFGYAVLEAVDGPAALRILGEQDDVGLLFTDVVMPGGMNGRELADAARALRPGLPVLFTSGYTEDAIVHQGRLDPDAHLLAKPYRRHALDRAIRAAIADRPTPPHA